MRTDTQRLDWLIDATETQSYDAGERLQAAFTLGLSGRVAIDAAMGAKLIEPGEPMPALTAIDLAAAELGRIRNVKGFNEDGDDTQINEQLARAAACYLLGDVGVVPPSIGESVYLWPWNPESFKPSPDDRKKELTKGIALALCELERLIRAERRAPVTVGIDLASGPDQCVVDGVLQPQPREFKVGDRVLCAQSVGYAGLPDPTFGTIVGLDFDGATVRVDGYVGGLLYWTIAELEHADD